MYIATCFSLKESSVAPFLPAFVLFDGTNFVFLLPQIMEGNDGSSADFSTSSCRIVRWTSPFTRFCKYHTSNDVFSRSKSVHNMATGKSDDELIQSDNKMRIGTRSGKFIIVD